MPEDWLSFEPTELTLEPGKTEKVQARLSLPTGADPGDYEGLLAAQIVTEGEGAQVGAAAAAKVTFEVESATLLGAYWHKLSTWFSANAPWTWVFPAASRPSCSPGSSGGASRSGWRSAREVARAHVCGARRGNGGRR